MKVNRKFIKSFKKVFNLYNLAMMLCIIVILASLDIVIKPNFNFSTIGNIQTNIQRNESEINEDEARKIAQKKFKKLGEKKINKESLKVTLIQRDNELYYYVCSLENTIEISQKSGKIVRVNSANVE